MFQAPLNKPLPRQGDPRKFAQQGISMSGLVSVSALQRLAGALTSREGDEPVELNFGINEARKKVETGTATADLSLVCQRCLNPVPVPIACDIALAIIWDEEDIKFLPNDLDPWIV